MDSTGTAIVGVDGIRVAAAADPAGCPHCTGGMAAGRLSLGAMWALVGQHLKLEKGLLRTLRDMVLRPGATLRLYFDGAQRRAYVNPVTYLLLSAASSLLVLQLYKDGYRDMLAQGLRAGMGSQAPVVPGTSQAEFVQTYTDVMIEVMQNTSLTSIALVALLVWLLFRGPRLNLAEALVFGLYAMGTGLFLHSLLITPLLAADMWTLGQHAGMALYLAIPFWMGLSLLGVTLGNAVRMLVATVGGYAIGSVGIHVLIGAIVAFRMLAH
jgi:small basic protein